MFFPSRRCFSSMNNIVQDCCRSKLNALSVTSVFHQHENHRLRMPSSIIVFVLRSRRYFSGCYEKEHRAGMQSSIIVFVLSYLNALAHEANCGRIIFPHQSMNLMNSKKLGCKSKFENRSPKKNPKAEIRKSKTKVEKNKCRSLIRKLKLKQKNHTAEI